MNLDYGNLDSRNKTLILEILLKQLLVISNKLDLNFFILQLAPKIQVQMYIIYYIL